MYSFFCSYKNKERNVDVEQKLNKFQKNGNGNNMTTDVDSITNIKRSTRCRLVFRCEIPETMEILQTVSTPILWYLFIFSF